MFSSHCHVPVGYMDLLGSASAVAKDLCAAALAQLVYVPNVQCANKCHCTGSQ